MPTDCGVSETCARAEDQQQDNQHVQVQNANNKINDEIDSFTCPVCCDIMEDVKITKCGHTYCHDCITKSIEVFKKCPVCAVELTQNDIFPNHHITKLVEKYKARIKTSKSSVLNSGIFGNLLTENTTNHHLHEFNEMIRILMQRQAMLETQESNKLLTEFFETLETIKKEKLEELNSRCKVIKEDLSFVENNLKALNIETSEIGESTSNLKFVEPKGFSEQRRQMYASFNDIADCYFETRLGESNHGHNNSELNDFGLKSFCNDFEKFFRYKSMKLLALMNYSHVSSNSTVIVSSIEFDKNNEFFAVAGIMRKIKIYNYSAVIEHPFKDPQDDLELMSTSKISCLSWNSAHENYLCSSDYEGTVIVWDTMTKTKLKAFSEHQKRCWSVNFNTIDHKILASASDDRTVKLWSIDMNRSVASLEANAKVCCVQFNPYSSCHLAFGTSDHRVHYYDIRNTKNALRTFEGHRKAVSYVKFLNDREMVSASTDSELKMWNVHTLSSLRSLSGHVNDKNFIGLATDGDYVACGSENNSLYFYFKKMKKPIFAYEFETGQSNHPDKLKVDQDNDLSGFVSAVCWRPNSNVWIAANSQSKMKVLELVK